MIDQKLKFKDYLCFVDDWAGFDKIYPVNIIIGKNNTGKSCLLDLIDLVVKNKTSELAKHASWSFSGIYSVNELENNFRRNTSGGVLGGYHWEQHGNIFIDKKVSWSLLKNGQSETEFNFDIESKYGAESTMARRKILSEIAINKIYPLFGKIHYRLLADRDIVPERPSAKLELEGNGDGATNIIRKFILSSDVAFRRDVIQRRLLEGMNTIFGKDVRFNEIQVQEHDHVGGDIQPKWEIFLGEERKGLIPLSRSGSGLKTVILVLLALIALPEIGQKHVANYVFSFEELENNLHPALLRRLLIYIENFAVENSCYIFLTTHSSIALDIFSSSNNAQIIRVDHNGKSATTKTIDAHFDALGVISLLGAKPSDLLQANCIVWVEGPSDRIYLNRWIHIISGGQLTEGRDYQCAFYGGSLLSNYTFSDPDNFDRDRANILTVNPNAILVADGDRTTESGSGSRIKQRVSRIKKEIEALPRGYVWVTDAKEIENYVPVDVLRRLFGKSNINPIGQYDIFSGSDGKGYYHKHSGRKTFDKVEFAREVVPYLTSQNIENVFELKEQVEIICNKIKAWNGT